MILTILLVVATGILGYFFGNAVERDRQFSMDPDNNVNSEDGSLQLLLFTKDERYCLGRATVLGSKKEMVEAKRKLIEKVAHISAIRFEGLMEDRKREGKFPYQTENSQPDSK
jgi:hypothetical protein